MRFMALAGILGLVAAVILGDDAPGVPQGPKEPLKLDAREARAIGKARPGEGSVILIPGPGDGARWGIPGRGGLHDLSIAYATGARGALQLEASCGKSTLSFALPGSGEPGTRILVPVGLLDLPRAAELIPAELILKLKDEPPGAGGTGSLEVAGLTLEDGFVSLFDGKTLAGWEGDTDGYAVEDGVLVCRKEKGGNLYARREYSDFIFRFELRLFPGSNNGLGLRTPRGVDAAYEGMEIQILDDPGYEGKIQPWQRHGSIYDVVPAKAGALRPTGEWNIEEVIANGRRVIVNLNGRTIVDADLDLVKDPKKLEKHPGLARKSGSIGFLGHGTRIELRNIRVKDLAPAAK